MTSWTSCLNKIFSLVVGALVLSGCASAKSGGAPAPPASATTVAVLPPENLSGQPAPMKEIEESLVKSLKGRGISVMDQAALTEFMARHRIRYTGGVDSETSRLIAEETPARAVLVTSVELYSPAAPPKFAITSRLVRPGGEPSILWTDGYGAAGDDQMGFMELGLVEDPKTMLDRGTEKLARSLAAYLSKGTEPEAAPAAGRFRPKFFYKSEVLSPGRTYRVAVVPFFNKSDRRYAGELMMLHFIKRLSEVKGMEVLEPGVVRDDLLRLRVVMEEGLTLDTADVVLDTLNADLLVMGSVLDYEDFQGQFGSPKVDFTVQVIEKKSLQIVWSSKSHNQGDDGVFFFDMGRINTANQTASEMVDAVAELLERD